MLEEYLENYVEKLYHNQNIGALKQQQGLYTKKDYYELLKPVVELVTKYKDYSLEEIRNMLYLKSGIEQKVKDFIYKKEITPGMVFSYGTKNYKETIIIGNRQEVKLDEFGNIVPSIDKMTEDTIFDLASVTKLFTSLSILKLVQNGTIHLNDEVTRYAPEFKNLKGVTIFDLISFGVPLKTKERVDGVHSKEEAEKILLDVYIDRESDNTSPYTDMGAMVLKYVIEHASGMNYYNFVEENILNKVNMKDTHVVVPKMKLYRLASTNLSSIYYKDGTFTTIKNKVGEVYDPKARIMGQPEGILSGHAGLFSTAGDMTNLAKGIMGGQIIDNEYVEMMAKNRTGRKYTKDNKEKYVQYLGFLCYSKHPILSDSELFHALSGKSFSSAGFNGTKLTVDPINELYFFLGSNRVHNRFSIVDPKQRDKITYDEHGKGEIILPNGEKKITSYTFAWDRDEVVVHPSLKLSIQYKMLEDIYKLMNEKIEKNENKRYL